MKLELTLITTSDEQIAVTASVPDFVAWERNTKRKISDLQNGIGIEDLLFLAHHALKRRGENVKPFDGWINEIDSIEPVDADPKVI